MSLKVVFVLAVLSLVCGGGVLAVRGNGWRHPQRAARGCRHRTQGGGSSQELEAGSHFMWSMTGLDNDGLSLTYEEGAFAPDESTTVLLYPKDRSQRALGLVPSRITYDFSTSDPMVAVRVGRFGRGPCILVQSDVSSYSDMMNMLNYKNGSNSSVPDQSETQELVASLITDKSEVSQSLRDICSKNKCGRSIQPVFYRTDPVTDDESSADEDAVDLVPDIVLLNDRISITGLPTPRGHGRRRGGRQGDKGRRQDPSRRRQQRRQNRRRGQNSADADADADAGAAATSRREDRRTQRRNERRQSRREQRRQSRRNNRGRS